MMYTTDSETIANMNNDTKASNGSTNRHRIAIHYAGYSEGSAVLSTTIPRHQMKALTDIALPYTTQVTVKAMRHISSLEDGKALIQKW